MERKLRRTSVILLGLGLAIGAACGGSASGEPSSSPAGKTASSAPAVSPPVGALRFEVSERSSVTIRVREQLANVPAPNDAELTVTGMGGQFTVLPDGTFGSDARISASVATIKSDQNNRDNFVGQSTLEVARFPTAEFVPTRASGLIVPLPAGDFSFRLTGDMTIHGVTKEVAFEVTARLSGAELVAKAEAAPTWKFGDFGMRVPSAAVVLSVQDEIMFSVDLIATRVN